MCYLVGRATSTVPRSRRLELWDLGFGGESRDGGDGLGHSTSAHGPYQGSLLAMTAPRCPLCGAAMRERRRRSDGRRFFGCSTYPSCRGTRGFNESGTTTGSRIDASISRPTGSQSWPGWLVAGLIVIATLAYCGQSSASPPRSAAASNRPVTSTIAPIAGPMAKCVDGSLSYSANHSGTCSHHGGVAEWYR